MSRTVTIPTTADPFIVKINNKEYRYAPGATVEVPDEVAAFIANFNKAKEKPVAEGTVGQVLTLTAEGAKWKDTQHQTLPRYYLHSVALNLTNTVEGTLYALSGIYNFESTSNVTLSKNTFLNPLTYHRVLFNGTLTVTPDEGEASIKTVMAIRKDFTASKLLVWCVGEANPIEMTGNSENTTISDEIGWIN